MFPIKDVYNISHKIDISHNKLYMKVTRIYREWFFPIEKAVKTVLLGEFVFIVTFLSYAFVDDIKMVRRFEFILGPLFFCVASTSY